ncbi:MAG: hypothetical protein JWP97_6336 [Labilithrix sp.]|nr:hypothetical protein [Labilithrix sp.]
MRAIPDQRQSRRTTLGLVLAGAVAGCALLVGAPSTAEAQPSTPKAEVLVIHGTQCATPSVDPAIGEVPPLKYNCYKLLDRKVMPLAQGTPSTMQLANGRTFQVAYNGVAGNPPRYRVATSISAPSGAGFQPLAELTAEPGRKFHVGGFAYQNGSLLLAIRILP